MKAYLAFLGAVGLFLSLLGCSRRTGDSERDWAAGLMALECWRWFRWISVLGAGLGLLNAVAVHFGWWPSD